MAVIALDLGGTKLAAAVFTNSGQILCRVVHLLEKRTGKSVGNLITSTIQEMRERPEPGREQISGVGICVPGISHAKTGRVWAPNIPGWDDYPLHDEIANSVNDRNIAVTIDSDRACSILGEAWHGAAVGCSDAIFLAVGTGIGAGIMIDRRVLRGTHDIGGAIGWMALDKPFRSEYVSCGCFEYHASGEGITKVAREYLRAEPLYTGPLRSKDPQDLTARDIFDAETAKDPLGVRVVGEAVQYWGMAVANLVSLFNPEKIVFGGGIFGPAVRYLGAIAAEAQHWAQPISIHQVTLEASRLGGDAGLTGAAFLACHQS